eukprot:3319944-Pleurochrysis_carterae.AAC.1
MAIMGRPCIDSATERGRIALLSELNQSRRRHLKAQCKYSSSNSPALRFLQFYAYTVETVPHLPGLGQFEGSLTTAAMMMISRRTCCISFVWVPKY